MKFKLLAILICLCVFTSCKHEGETDIVIEEPGIKVNKKIPPRYTEGIPNDNVELGMGWDSRRGEVVPNVCIKFSPVKSSGQELKLSMREVSDKSEIMDSLGVSAEISVKTMFASGSAQASFASNSKVSSSSTTLMLHASVDNGEIFVGPTESSGIPRSAYPKIVEDTLSYLQRIKGSVPFKTRF